MVFPDFQIGRFEGGVLAGFIIKYWDAPSRTEFLNRLMKWFDILHKKDFLIKELPVSKLIKNGRPHPNHS